MNVEFTISDEHNLSFEEIQTMANSILDEHDFRYFRDLKVENEYKVTFVSKKSQSNGIEYLFKIEEIYEVN